MSDMTRSETVLTLRCVITLQVREGLELAVHSLALVHSR